MVFALLLGFVIAILICVSAVRGASYRGAYIAGGLIFFGIAGFSFLLIVAPLPPSPERLPESLTLLYSILAGSVWFFALLGFGSLVAGAFYRPRTHKRTEVAPSAEREMKKCPDCSELVLADARKCRFCGHRFGGESQDELTSPAVDAVDASKAQGTGGTVARGMGSPVKYALAVLAVLGLLIIGIPLTTKQFGSEHSAALFNVRIINTACVTYASMYEGFPLNLEELGPPSYGRNASAASADLIDDSLCKGEKGGYFFGYRCHGKRDRYTVIARPLVYGETGRRNYYTDETAVVRFTDENREARNTDQQVGE